MALKKQIVSTPQCLVILINFLFGPFSLEMKLFDTKLYFTCILILEFEKRKREIYRKITKRREN
jgi:hypothetical protein